MSDPASPSFADDTEPPGVGAIALPARRRRRLWRVVRWGLGSLLVMVLLALGSVWLVLGNLNHPSVKSRIVSLVKSNAGLEIDYEELEISLGDGVTARSIQIAAPQQLAHHAPAFVTVSDLDIGASLWGLAFGDRSLERIRIGAVSMHLVSDEHGQSTLGLLFPPSDEPPQPPEPPEPQDPPKPLSQSLADLPEISIAELGIGPIELVTIELAQGEVIRRSSLSGLAIAGSVAVGAGGLDGTAVTIRAADGTDGLVVTLEEQDAAGQTQRKQAVLNTELSVGSEAAESLAVRVKADVVRQDLVDTVAPIESLLALSAAVSFQPGSGTTTLRLAELSAVDGALSTNLEIRIPDVDGPFRAHIAGSGKLRLPRLPIAVPGVELEGARLDFRIADVDVAGTEAKGTATAEGRIDRVAYDSDGQRAEVRGLDLQLEASLDDQPVGAAALTIAAESIEAAVPPSVPPEDPTAVAADGAGATAVKLAGLSIEIVGRDVPVLYSDPPSTPSQAVVKLAVDRVEAATGGNEIQIDKLGLTADGAGWPEAITAGEPVSARLRLPIGSATVRTSDGQTARVSGVEVGAVATGVVADEAAPFGARGSIDLTVAVDAARHRGGGKGMSAEGLELSAKAPLSGEAASGHLAVAGVAITERGTESLSASGARLEFRADSPLAMAPDARGEAGASLTGRVEHLEVAGGSRASVSSIEIRANKTADGAYSAQIDTTAGKVAVDGRRLAGDISSSLTAKASLREPRVAVELGVEGPAGPAVRFVLDAGFERSTGALRYQTELSAAKLDAIEGPLRALVEPLYAVNLRGARVSVSGTGALRGLLTARAGQMPALAPDPLRTLRGDQSIDVELAGIRYAEVGATLELPKATIGLKTHHGDGGAGSVELDVRAARLGLDSAAGSIDVRGLSERLEVRFPGPPEHGTMTVKSSTRLASVEQTMFPEYEVSDLSVTADVALDRMRTATIKKLVIDNPGAKTSLKVSGIVERSDTADGTSTIPGREALTLTGEISQELPPMQSWGFAERASGAVAIPFRVESGDLVSFRLSGEIQAKHVTLALASGLQIIDLNGVIPILEEVALLPDGAVLLPGPSTSALARTRFFDVHPFVDSNDYLTASKVVVGGETFGPIAGNVRLSRSAFWVDQLQMEYRRGKITGQIRADYRAGDPTILLRLNATGIRPAGSSEVLDANAALTFRPRTLAVDGKVQIVRIGRDHLREVLNLLDPYRENTSVNRIRLALRVGYPKFVRIRVDGGTVDAKIELGGLAEAIRIDEIKAVPIGPLLEQHVAPILAPLLDPKNEQADEDEPEESEPGSDDPGPQPPNRKDDPDPPKRPGPEAGLEPVPAARVIEEEA